jgi:hypothetical protein
MIDTIKFKVEATDDVLNKIRAKSLEFRGFDHETKRMAYQIFKKTVFVGSYHYGIVITLYDKSFFIEFSVPKYVYNHNILLFPVEKLESVLYLLHEELERFFRCKILTPLFWEVYRLDLCYAWKFYDDDTAQKVIEYIKNQNFMRKKTANYGTSAMFVGSDYSIKFYMKGAEFYAHDYKRIKVKDFNTATNLLDLARGIVRYEITLRHAQVNKHLHITSPAINIYSLLTREYIISILSNSLSKLFGLSPTTMSAQTTYDILRRNFVSATKARSVYLMYRLFTSSCPTDRAIFMSIPKSSRNRYKGLFKRLRLGIPTEIADTEISLSIPSPYGVAEFSP